MKGSRVQISDSALKKRLHLSMQPLFCIATEAQEQKTWYRHSRLVVKHRDRSPTTCSMSIIPHQTMNNVPNPVFWLSYLPNTTGKTFCIFRRIRYFCNNSMTACSLLSPDKCRKIDRERRIDEHITPSDSFVNAVWLHCLSILQVSFGLLC